jgi:hypothetical protein
LGGANGAGAVQAVIDYVAKLRDRIAGPLGQLKKIGGSPFAEIVKKFPHKIADAMIEKIKGLMATMAASAGPGGSFTAAGGGSNRAIGKRMMLQRWPITQWPALNSLWTKESGWNTHALNKSSGAYGIPQSLPASKMASAGSDWRNNPATQIKWGLGYIASVYGSPSKAWSHSIRTNWYGNGGVIPEPVVGLGLKSGESYRFGEKGKEMVVPMAGNMGVPSSSGGRPLRIQLDLGQDLRYYVEGIIDDNDEFKAGIGRLSR